MVELPRRELAVPARRSLPMWLPVIVACAVAVGAGLGNGLEGARILVAVVGFAGLVLAAVALLRPPTLVLDAAGFSLRTPLGERWRMAWTDCGEFRPWRGSTVVWASRAEAVRRPRSAAGWRKRAGEEADVGLASHFGLAAVDLAALLNRYRAAALTKGPC